MLVSRDTTPLQRPRRVNFCVWQTMKSFPIRQIRSGAEPGYGYVSIWYNAGSPTLDVLHIVCDPDGDKIYMEGAGQMIAAWGGAKSILVNDSTIEFDLTTKAAKQLRLKAKFSLSVSGKLAGWKKARKLFQKMTEFPAGKCIQLAEP